MSNNTWKKDIKELVETYVDGELKQENMVRDLYEWFGEICLQERLICVKAWEESAGNAMRDAKSAVMTKDYALDDEGD